MNWVDIFIGIGLLLFTVIGVQRGFLIGIVELIGIMVSVTVPLILYTPASNVLEDLGVSQVYSNALAFIIIFFVTVLIFFAIAGRFYRMIPRKVRVSKGNKVLGLFAGLAKGLIVITLILIFVAALPIPFISSENIEESYVGTRLLDTAAAATSATANIFGEAFKHAAGFITIETEGLQAVDLSFKVADPLISDDAEMEMFRLVNEERALRGLPELEMDESIREVARMHSVDMFQKGYFSHVDPQGNTFFERMINGGITFTAAGENLAMAPTVSIAHQGLMDSPGHRENILRPEFRRIGIGAASHSRYGIMFTQKFAD